MEIVADLHTHTIACGHAYSTLEEMVAGAKQNGIEIMATTDHGPCMPGANHPYYFGNLHVLPAVIEGVRVLKGVECNITDIHGSLDLPSKLLQRMEIVLAGFHPLTGYQGSSKKEHTQAMLNAIRNPLVDVIVHPGNPQFEIEIEQVVNAALENEVLLEINNSSFLLSRDGSREYCLEIALQAKKVGLQLLLNSDAHFSADVGRIEKARQLVKEVGLTAEDVLNTSLVAVKEFIAEKMALKQGLDI
ncbi:phosphatase [Fuchsiella alkaliacetigena]|uniref:phosphatase n=1 Tax=Fuchsiella alkaliacetigena TaxID=957042 RepID=UPI003555EE68